ncbi:LacI family DNA-binding transcriptional regulator [Microbacterium sp. A93]|uniref:LacI family DNA-binding transcriptional regulator n=1 Tax=Microbacterium sp. A93 TaxID=3450716 RepID=UPI003F4267B5
MTLTTRPSRATITDVARIAGVSVSTVSKVVNGRDGIAAATAARVLSVVEELGYETSIVASSLRRSRTGVIGVLLADFEPYSTELLKGISRAAEETSYELLAYAGGNDDGKRSNWERRSLSRLGGTLIDGAVVVAPTMSMTNGTSIPVVAIDPHTGIESVPTVDGDNVAGARAATDLLIGLGHRRIAHLGGRPGLESSRLRREGYAEALKGAGIEVDPALDRIGGYRADLTDAPAHELLRLPAGVRPTAIFAANDLSALHVIEVARELGLRVPQDLSVVGFDDIPESSISSPPLTTVTQPLQQMGADALRILISLLAGDAVEEQHLRLPATLTVRESVAAPPSVR